ncbi:MAG: biopolymer transporter ExbD [Burkholderiales bacterium]|nr:biopolymer transporter ExbD [Burkholderiales bacterium]
MLQTLDEPEVMMDINTTPLIDVMLVLLIMLIITIPVQLHSINLDMPAGSPPPVTKKPNIVRIDIDARNAVRWNDKALTDRAELEVLLQIASQQQPQPEIHIKPNSKSKYETVAGVLASAQRNGLSKLGIVGSEQFAGNLANSQK